jgi:integrase
MPQHVRDPLTDSQIRGFAPGLVKYEKRDGFSRGLILVIYPSGAKQWSVRYRAHGKQRRLILGEFPKMTLAAARREADKYRPSLRDGQDVAVARRAAKAAPGDTVGALAEAYLARHAKPNKKDGGDGDDRTLRVDVLPFWQDRSVRELTRRDVVRLVDRVIERGSPIMANRVLAVVRKMLNFAVDHGWLDANPAARIPRPTREISRDRVLTDDEVRAVWHLLGRFPATHEKRAPGRPAATHNADGEPFCPVSAPLAAAFKVRILTAQRGGEVIAMRWRDLDLAAAVWTIPGAVTKNGVAHRVPLTPDALALVEAQRPTDEHGAPVKTPKPDALVFVGSGASLADRHKKAPTAIATALGIADMTGHDFRRTAASRMAEAGVTREHISRVLNHVDGGPRATAVYQRYDFDKEKRAALDVWARVLDRIVNAGEVVAFGARR